MGKTLQLSGLQPDTEYAYRISIKSGYGTNIGESAVFTTASVPVLALPQSPILLPSPAEFKFPKTVTKVAKCKSGYSRNKQGKCVKIKKRTKKTISKAHKSKK